MTSDNDKWIAVYTKPKQEQIAIENIARQGFETYCPMIKRRISHARKVQMVLRPLFASYIFVKLAGKKPHWQPIQSSRGVTSIVRFGDKLGFLPNMLIEQLRNLEENGLLHQTSKSDFQVGEDVRITDGPFKDFMAKVLSESDKGRIWLLLDLMGQTIRVRQDALSVSRGR